MKNNLTLFLFAAMLPYTAAQAADKAAPRFYLAGQIGVFAADAGTPAAYGGIYLDRGIKSGTKSFSDWSVGIKLLNRLSLEAGYVDFASFSSADFVLRPDIITIRPEAVWQTYELRGFRLTPIFTVHLTDRFSLRFLGGLIHPTGRVVRRDRFLASYQRSASFANLAYQIGVGAAWKLSEQVGLEGRVVRYDFGKPEGDPNRITATNCSLGLVWHF